MQQPMYEILVAGEVPEETLKDMGAVTVPHEPVNTVLYGVTDEAALYGLLARLRALGIDLVEVRRVGEVPPEARDDVLEPGTDDAEAPR
jgi:hypothetical protein